jgi:uncharacterized membrane protein
MQIDIESSLQRWTEADLLSFEQATRIREFETERSPRRGARAPILLGLALGSVMLAAGVLLFVAAHWTDLSPAQRMTLLVALVGGAHVAGAVCGSRFPSLGVTLHGVGTAALGGAIFLAGQTFNMQEHWPAGVLMWAIGAVAGWWMLRSWPQLAFSALLVPFWLIGEWTEAVPKNADAFPVVAAFCALLAICYLSVPDRMFVWIGGLALIPSVLTLVLWNWRGTTRDEVSGPLDVFGWLCALLLPVAFAAIYRRRRAWMNGVAAVWVFGLSALTWHNVPIWIFVCCAIGSAGMIAWGIAEFRSERINLGMAGFALTILFFYFSSVMDKLGRSTSLIVLGILFLAGAWYWEKLRRKLVARTQSGGAV